MSFQSSLVRYHILPPQSDRALLTCPFFFMHYKLLRTNTNWCVADAPLLLSSCTTISWGQTPTLADKYQLLRINTDYCGRTPTLADKHRLVRTNSWRREQKGVVGACDRAARLTQAQVQQFKPRADVVEDLHGLFGEDVSKLKMTSMADSMHALSCHNMTLPCSDKVGEHSIRFHFVY